MTDDGGIDLLLADPFPDPEPTAAVTTEASTVPNPPASRKTFIASHGGRRRWTVIGTVAALLAASSGAVWAATGSAAATYRTSAAQAENIDQTLNSYGTITPIHQATVDFPVGGTVATVPVAVGEHVTSGQALASLSPTSLQASLDQAQSTLATAQAKLATDTNAQATGASVSSSAGTGSTSTATTTAALTPASVGPATVLTAYTAKGSSSTGTAAQAAVTAAQKTLLADQRTVDALTAQVTADLRSGTSTCASLIASLQNLTTATATSVPSASPSTPSTPSTGRTTPVPDTSACTTLLNKVLGDQQAVSAAQNTVSTDEATLTSAVSKLLATAQTGQSTTTTSGTGAGSTSSVRGGSSSTSSTSGSGGTSHSSGGGTTVTAAQLVVDQATVDADTDAAFVAAEALNQATVVSPLAGTVAAISVKPGASVSAQAAAVTVIGPGVDEVSTTVSDLNLSQIRVGASATVTPDGSNTTVHGTVILIGLLPVSSSTSTGSGSTGSSGRSSTTAASSTTSSGTTSSTTSYPVIVSLDSGGLYSGSGADVSILVKHVSNVLAVPTSAVTALGTRHSVTTLKAGKVTRTLVTVGASDPTYTQITSGLKKGQQVSLAQLNLAVPSSGSTSLSSRALGGSRTGGAGFGGAGTSGTSRATAGTVGAG